MPRMTPAPEPKKATRAELERAAALLRHRAELDAMMPEKHYSKTYICQMCGLVVGDRQIHLNTMHSEGKFLNVLKDLFGED